MQRIMRQLQVRWFMTFSAKPIIPKLINVRDLQLAIVSAGADIADGIAQDYRDSQSTWNNKSEPVRRRPRTYTWQVEVVGEIFRFVDHGTRRRTIRAKRASALRFRTGYRRKTVRGAIRARQGGPSGDFAYAKEVKHPGTKGAFITKSIHARWFLSNRAKFFADRELKAVING